MKLYTLLFLLSLNFANSAFGAESDVLNLGDTDFNTRVSEVETTLVMFYGNLT